MSSKYFETHEELKEAFGIDNLREYEAYTPLKDTRAGFSVQRKYPENIRYKPAIAKNGNVDSVALIIVYAIHPDEASEKIKDNKISIVVRISTHSKYLSNNWNYDFEKDECPTKDSLEESKNSPKPAALDSFYEYFYDFERGVFVDKANKQITGKVILDAIFEEHCNTIHWFKGLRIQWLMGSNHLIVQLLEICIIFSKWFLMNLTGRTLDSKGDGTGVFRPFDREDMKLLSTERINVFNYEASKQVIILFCLLVCAAHAFKFLFPFENAYISSVQGNNTVLICFTILVLWFLDRILPLFIFYLINLFIELRVKRIFRKFKV